MIEELRRMNVRQLASQGINLGLIVTSALMIWKSLVLFTGTESPVVVVLSGSMEPGFYRGDILFLYMNGPIGTKAVRASDIVVYNLDQREIPIVHRVSKVHEREDGHFDLLTKGDNNYGDDRGGIYPRGQMWLQAEHIQGRVVGYLPYVGMVTIMMNDYPYLKYALIGLLGIFVLTDRE